MADDTVQCLRNFYGSETFSMLKELPSQMWLEVEEFSSFFLDQIKIWAVLDCSFRTDDGITIIDWKTGRGATENVSLQLACYAMYAMEKWGIEPDRIKLIEYNLLANRSSEFRITADEITYIKTYIMGSISDMQSMLLDIENNVPKEESFFQKVDDERVRANCNFKKVCEKK